jgi:hypothetical protein
MKINSKEDQYKALAILFTIVILVVIIAVGILASRAPVDPLVMLG